MSFPIEYIKSYYTIADHSGTGIYFQFQIVYNYTCIYELFNFGLCISFILQGELPSTIHLDEALWTLGKS